MDFIELFRGLNDMIAHSASQWWIVPLVTLFCLIDGFFIFLPSETALVALAAVSLSTGEPNVWLLMAGGAVGAIIGDNIAYQMGRRIGTAGFKWMRRPKVAKAFDWARMELDKRGAVLILTARYIPVGRVAVNFTAGATQYSWRKFAAVDAIACITWAAYSVGIGTFAGSWIKNNHLLGVGIAIVFAIIVGFIVDHLMKLFHKWLEKRSQQAAAQVPAGESLPGESSPAESSPGEPAVRPESVVDAVTTLPGSESAPRIP